MKTTVAIFMIMLAVQDGYSQMFKKKETYDHRIFDTSFVQVGKSQAEFAEWAESIGQWRPSNVINNGSPAPNQSWDSHYTITIYKQFDGNKYNTRYQYIFKDDQCIEMIVTPDSFDNYKDELLKDHTFVQDDPINDSKVNHVFAGVDYRAVVVETVKDSGFEKKFELKLHIKKA